jgi:hypothetical protein
MGGGAPVGGAWPWRCQPGRRGKCCCCCCCWVVSGPPASGVGPAGAAECCVSDEAVERWWPGAGAKCVAGRPTYARTVGAPAAALERSACPGLRLQASGVQGGSGGAGCCGVARAVAARCSTRQARDQRPSPAAEGGGRGCSAAAACSRGRQCKKKNSEGVALPARPARGRRPVKQRLGCGGRWLPGTAAARQAWGRRRAARGARAAPAPASRRPSAAPPRRGGAQLRDLALLRVLARR